MEKQRVKKIFKGIGRALSIALVVLEVIMIIFLVASKIQGEPPTIFGYQTYFIRTGSMQDGKGDDLVPGDVIISKKYDGGELAAGREDGDVVTFYGDVGGTSALITHRVIEVDGDEVITQGDANNVADDPITKNDIEAVMVYKTVVISKIYKVISSTWGFWLLIFTPIALLIVSEIVSLVIELKKEKDRVNVTVFNSGEGIKEEDVPHIFEKFYQADRSRNDRGSGLGLSLVKRLVELCGGEISVKSEIGAGAEFKVILPLERVDGKAV